MIKHVKDILRNVPPVSLKGSKDSKVHWTLQPKCETTTEQRTMRITRQALSMKTESETQRTGDGANLCQHIATPDLCSQCGLPLTFTQSASVQMQLVPPLADLFQACLIPRIHLHKQIKKLHCLQVEC